MKLIAGVTITISLLVGLFAVVAVAQDVVRLTTPLLVDVRQSVPVTLTLAVPSASGVQTVTAPLSLDVALQVSLSGVVSPVVAITSTSAAALVSVSELLAQGEPLTDALGIPYTIEAADSIEVVQLKAADNYGFEIIGELRNLSEDTINDYDIDAVLTLYDADGAILAIRDGMLGLSSVDSGQTTPVQFVTSADVDDIGRYLVQVKVR